MPPQEAGGAVSSKAWHMGYRGTSMHTIIPAILLGYVLLTPAQATEPMRNAVAPQVLPKTAKERLSDKASDEQRVNDCKVPAERRTRARSTHCPWEVGS
jgi:hypothetical protein